MINYNSCEKKSDGPLAQNVLRTSNMKEVTQNERDHQEDRS